MPAAKFSLTAGLHTGVREATPEHCSEALNFFSWQGRLRSRDGMVPVEAIVGPKVTPYVGFGAGDPVSVANAGTVTAGAHDYVYVGAASAFNRALLHGASIASEDLVATRLSNITAQYWNGTAWTTIDVAHLWKPKYVESGGNGAHTVAPFMAYDPAAAGIVITDTHINIVLEPPTDWATKAVAGQTKYWLRLRWAGDHNLVNATVTDFGTNTWVQTTENRVLNVTTWTDANGTPHRFIAYLYGDDGTALRFSLDGTVLTQSDGLQPDGTSEMFNTGTRVDAFYDPTTDRLVGHISGHVWFFCIPGNGEIYSFDADSSAVDTPYESLAAAGGLRSALPSGKHIVMHDSRIFVLDGQSLKWSAPSPFLDVWPNDNEIPGGIVDGNGEGTGLASIAGVLVVFKRNSLFTMQPDSNTSDGYLAAPYPAGIGAVGGVAGCGDFVVFVATDGLWQFDGQNIQKLSGAIDEAFFESVLSSDIRKARAVYHPPLNQMRIFYPSTGQSDILDAALYVDLTGFTHNIRGEEQKEISIWPQGKYASTDYFHATALCEDSTTDERVMLVGDKYGVVWEADEGDYDGPTMVQAKAIQALVGTGSAQMRFVRWVSATVRNLRKMAATLKLIPDGIASASQSQTINTSKSSTPTGTLTTGATLAAGQTLKSGVQWVTRENPVGMRTRNFQIGVYKTTAGSLEIAGFELEARPAGRRNEG